MSALVVMTPLTEQRLGAEREAIERGIVEMLPRSELVLADDPRALRRLIGELEPEVIVAAGGDGTANLALQAMRERDALAVLPLGTANDLAGFLGVSRNPGFIGSFVLRSACRIDLLRVNGQRFCTTGGLGLPAEVANRVNLLRNAGRGAYLAALGSKLYPVIAAECCVRAPALYRLEICWEQLGDRSWKQIEVTTHGLFVTNQATFARSLQVVEDADNSDGRFELCVMMARGRVELLGLLGQIVQHAIRPGALRTLRTRRARIRADREVRFFGDGEILCKASEFELEVAEGGLRLLS
ncbi:MAG: diacylglycerol kinase family protein [Enhygromyxa sp.]